MSGQYNFGFATRPALRLSEIEEILRRNRAIVPIPSRTYFLKRLEDGTLDGYRTQFGWLVYEDSFKSWVKKLSPQGV